MWNHIEAEEIVGKDRFIDKVGLIKDFLHTEYETTLSDPEKLRFWLREDEAMKKRGNLFGTYCIYDIRRSEVLYVGKSKNVKTRIREQLIGRKNRKTGLLKFTRLFFGVLKREENMKQKEYHELSPSDKKGKIGLFQSLIFRPNNVLRISFTKNDIEARVLENTLINYFAAKGQCKYNFQK